ncbi:unnamed protein product, partial [Didymodactylos carnosus]
MFGCEPFGDRACSVAYCSVNEHVRSRTVRRPNMLCNKPFGERTCWVTNCS